MTVEQELTSLRQAVVDLADAAHKQPTIAMDIWNAIQKHSALIDRARKQLGEK